MLICTNAGVAGQFLLLRGIAVLLWLSSAFAVVPVLAQERIDWATDSWQGFTDNEDSGLYVELLDEIFPSADFHVDIHFYPWSRVMASVINQSADMTGAIPPDPRFYLSQHAVLSQPISVLYARDRFDIATAAQLTGLKGTWRQGYKADIVDKVLPSPVLGVAATDIDTALRLLSSTRIDYYIDIRTVIDAKLAQWPLAAGYKVADVGFMNIYWAFAKNPKGARLKQVFDQRFAELKASGRLQQLYDKYRVPMPKP